MSGTEHEPATPPPTENKNELRRRAVLVGALALVGLVLSFAVYLVADVARRLPAPGTLATVEDLANATVVYDAYDRPAFTFFREQRLRVPLERVSPHLRDAVLAIEDQRFYEHDGIDLVRVLGATVANLRAGRIVEGGSTITQQLARQGLLTTERSFARKLAEMLTATWIEIAYEKEEILELYLNRIYFGSGFHGAEAAARGYFGKPAAELGVSEAALLAGLIQAPERYSPRKFPERAIERRDVVLRVMVETGAIEEPAYRDARREALALDDTLSGMEPSGSYFKEEIRRKLIEMFGWDAVHEQGLRVDSTIDPTMQRAAEEAVEREILKIEARSNYRHPPREVDAEDGATTGEPSYLQGALIALDPVSGEVRALVGGRDFADSPFNRATQAHRQPGSAFKPILYAAAVDQGMTPTTLLDDLDDPMHAEEGAWLPAEGHEEYSSLTMRTSLRMSSNRGAVSLIRRTGVDRVVDYAARFGLGEQPRVPSVALGSGSVTLDRLTAAYAAFANGGKVPSAVYIRRVTDANGKVLFEAPSSSEKDFPRAVSPATAFITAALLRDVLDAGTGWRVREEGFRAPAGGKTGTTDDYKDAWFIGFTPTLAAGVWIGFDEPRTIVTRGFGSDLAAPVWARFMSSVDDEEAASGWIEPPGDVVAVEVCTSSLAVATDACRRANAGEAHGAGRRSTYVEYFVSGTEPVDDCPEHRSLFAVLTAPFRSSGGAEPPASATRLEREAVLRMARAIVPVTHDHLFGSCAGRLVVGTEGLHYLTDHQDGFSIRFTQLAGVAVDVERRHVRVSVREGRTYNFQTAPDQRGALVALEDALDAN